MTMEIGWINFEETVIAFNFRGKWTAEDFYLALDEIRELLREKPYSVQLVIDVSYSITPPPNLMTLLRMAFKTLPSNIEQAVIISKSKFWVRVFQILEEANLVPFALQFVNNADDAYLLLDDHIG